MAFVEDRQLIELSLSPKQSLFPVLSRAEAMSPLIVLLALIPPLYVLANRTLTPLDAVWGLKAIALSISDSAGTWIDPAQTSEGSKEIFLKYQPPLSSWIVAGVMAVTGTERPLALVLGSFLATAGLIVFVFGLTDRLRGPQFAWWTTCLVAFHGPILQGTQTPAPVALTLAFAVAACWGFVVHLHDSKRPFSIPLAWAGLAFGLCLLAGGPVALVMAAVLLLFVLLQKHETKPTKKPNGGKAAKGWVGRPALESLGLMILLGLAVGGWWMLWMFFQHGFEFLSSWIIGGAPVPDATPLDLPWDRQLLYDLAQMGGALSGLILLGIGMAVVMLRKPNGKAQRNSLVLILAWAGCAATVWLSLRLGQHQNNSFAMVWRGFCLVPSTLLAALAIEEIGARNIGYFRVFFALCLTLMILLVAPVEFGFGMDPAHHQIWPSIAPAVQQFTAWKMSWYLVVFLQILSLGAAAILASWGLWRVLYHNDFRQRVFLGICLGIFVGMHGLLGFLGVRQSTLDDRALANLRKENDLETSVVRWSIVSPTGSPLRLRFVLTSMWPRVDYYETDSWWDPKLTRDLVEDIGPDGAHIVIDWNDRDSRTPMLRLKDGAGGSHIVEFTPIGTPQILWNHRLRMYSLTDRLIRR